MAASRTTFGGSARPVLASRGRVLDHDDRAVDDSPKSMAPEAHQAAGDAGPEHQVEGEQHRQRDRRGHDEAGAQVAEEDEQHGDDEQRALERFFLTVWSTASTSVGALVDRVDFDARRAGVLPDLFEAQLEPFVTSWLFSPMSMKPSPSTASPLPSAVTAPRRISRPVDHASRRRGPGSGRRRARR
jgi:hypothetical protein